MAAATGRRRTKGTCRQHMVPFQYNPLVVTEDGRLLAADAKVNFDDNALFRHPEVQA